MSQPSIDHTKLLALDVKLEQNPTRGSLNIEQKQDKIEKNNKRQKEQIFYKNPLIIATT
jgi:hypothetical protein